jgi:hypothetical protein
LVRRQIINIPKYYVLAALRSEYIPKYYVLAALRSEADSFENKKKKKKKSYTPEDGHIVRNM